MEKYLYIWAQDSAHVQPDFLAVVDFNRESATYGKVLSTVPIPPPGNTNNEPHHCHLNVSQTILACGGLLSLLSGQNGIFFFDVTSSANPRFLFSTKAVESAITDDFLPTAGGGFLITQMGSASGGAPGRVAEYDGSLHLVGNHFGTISLLNEWPSSPPMEGFNPHGISARTDLNLMMTADFVLPSSTLDISSGVVLRGSVRVWDYNKRRITQTISVNQPGGSPALGTMDVKMLPGDPKGIGYTAGMFDGHIYEIDPITGASTVAFDSSTINPGFPVPGGMPQLMATPQRGDRLIVGYFMAGSVVMFDTTDRTHLVPVATVTWPAQDNDPVNHPVGAHNLILTADDSRLVVSDYFLKEDLPNPPVFGMPGLVQDDGDHKIHVLNLTRDSMVEDPRFNLDLSTAIPGINARPHGMAVK